MSGIESWQTEVHHLEYFGVRVEMVQDFLNSERLLLKDSAFWSRLIITTVIDDPSILLAESHLWSDLWCHVY